MNLENSIAKLQSQGFLSKLTPELLNKYLDAKFQGRSLTIDDAETPAILLCVLENYYVFQEVEPGIGVLDGFLFYVEDLEESLFDLVSRFTKIIGKEILKQIKFTGGLVFVRNDLGEDYAIDYYNLGFGGVGIAVNEELAKRNFEKRFYFLNSKKDSFSFIYLDEKVAREWIRDRVLPFVQP